VRSPEEQAASELADLRRQVEELRQAVRARDDFIAIAAHELRNPMTPILGVAELALTAARNANPPLPPRVTVLMERMQVLVQDFIKRATRLLDVGRIESDNLLLDPAATDLSALVRHVAQKYASVAVRGGSTLELDIQDGVAGVLDQLAVEQVVENLLSNALKFGMGKPVAVRLRSDGVTVRLDVQDQGIGMQPDQQVRIFARFEQVMAEHRGQGFGIGLWVANRMVTAMDGRIAVSSVVDHGSTFTVMLPLAPPDLDRTTHDAT